MIFLNLLLLVLGAEIPAGAPDEIPESTAVCIMDGHSLDILYEENGSLPLVPASTLKVLTAAAVLDALGEDYRFKTELYCTPEPVVQEDGRLAVENIYIKGYGDPTLVSEEWQRLVENLPAMDVKGALVIDSSYFSKNLGIIQEPGIWSPYNAINSAVAANYNTMAFSVVNGDVRPEEHTPLVPSYVHFNIGRQRRGYYVDLQTHGDYLEVIARGRWSANPKKFRIHLGFSADQVELYAGHLFNTMYGEYHQKPLAKKVRLGTVPENAYLLTTFRSQKTVTEAIRGLLEYSNNFLANQLLLVAGAEHFGEPATMEKGLLLLTDWLERHNLQNVTVYEASGLDPRNRISACNLASILADSFDHGRLAPKLFNQVPGYFHKTGTFTKNGVRNVAGYLYDGNSMSQYTAVFMCNGLSCDSAVHQQYKDAGGAWAQFLYSDTVSDAVLAPWP